MCGESRSAHLSSAWVRTPQPRRTSEDRLRLMGCVWWTVWRSLAAPSAWVCTPPWLGTRSEALRTNVPVCSAQRGRASATARSAQLGEDERPPIVRSALVPAEGGVPPRRGSIAWRFASSIYMSCRRVDQIDCALGVQAPLAAVVLVGLLAGRAGLVYR